MQTNGPIHDYARYVSATTNQLLRPHAPGETSDASIFIYRQKFSVLCQLTLLPSLFISGFVVVFYQLLFPRLFETQYQADTNLQVLEFSLYLFGGVTAGFIVGTIGLARIATFAHVLVEAAIRGEEINRVETERRAAGYFGVAYRTMLRSIWFTLSVALIAVVPIIIAGLLLSITKDDNLIPSVIGVYSVLAMPVALIWSITRLNIGLGATSVALNENRKPKDSLLRARYLFGSKSKPLPRTNPASSAIAASLLLYLFLRIGYSVTMSQLGIPDYIINNLPTPYLKTIANIFFGILPEFVAIWLVTPYIAVAAALFYYQRRISVEGLDISILYDKLPSNRR
jgi:hypothetical protein